ncbi:MAG: hypothetical protein OXC37_02350, partial [Bdellovibrionaceae bacterium]|nr:hypothetical protein [Pseudobdellovibrionaceae bacterium]
MKVYELAKKLEVTSIFLMNKIKKELKLPVKNHMETLSPEFLKKIESSFKKSSAKKTKTKSKTTKTIKTKTLKKTSLIKKKSIVKKPSTKKTSSKSNETETATQTAVKSQAPKRKIIIRRQSDKKPIDKKIPTKNTSSTSDKTETTSQTPVKAQSASAKNVRLDLVSVKSTDPLDDSFWSKEEPVPVKKQPKKPI